MNNIISKLSWSFTRRLQYHQEVSVINGRETTKNDTYNKENIVIVWHQYSNVRFFTPEKQEEDFGCLLLIER